MINLTVKLTIIIINCKAAISSKQSNYVREEVLLVETKSSIYVYYFMWPEMCYSIHEMTKMEMHVVIIKKFQDMVDFDK